MPLTFETQQLMTVPVNVLETANSTAEDINGLKLTTLPNELQMMVFGYLNIFDRASLALSCKPLARVAVGFDLLTFDFHLPVHTFPDADELTDYEQNLRKFLLRLSEGWVQSKAVRFCQCCGKFVPRSKQYWEDMAMSKMLRSSGAHGAKWRRARQHFGDVYPFRQWVDKWCSDEVKSDRRINCPQCKVLASSG